MTTPGATPEVLRGMLEKADEMLSSASRDVAAGDYGDAASRAYYAVFHAVSAALAGRGLSTHADLSRQVSPHPPAILRLPPVMPTGSISDRRSLCR